MDISFDPAKRDETLRNRGLDFADAGKVFMGTAITVVDRRFDYGETRYITAGYLDGRCVVLVWTTRHGSRRIISMRHTHADEEKNWFG
jgi:uncharacterized DUF497 family protein